MLAERNSLKMGIIILIHEQWYSFTKPQDSRISLLPDQNTLP